MVNIARVDPITPSDVIARKKTIIPDAVIETFNDLIAKNFSNGSSTVLQDEAAAAIRTKLGISDEEIFRNHYLDVEGIFEAAGWMVAFDKPGYNESYPACFTFRAPQSLKK